jgi:transglutaminase-like putative cysteine protease
MKGQPQEGERAVIHRRDFVTAGLSLPMLALALPSRAVQTRWRTFEVTIRVDVVEPRGVVRVWVPQLPTRISPYQQLAEQMHSGNARHSRSIHSGADMWRLEWGPETPQPYATFAIKAATRRYEVPLDAPRATAAVDRASVARYLAPTRLIPTDGIVRETALGIVRGHQSPLARARAIYDWVVDNTFRDPSVEGCGLGDIRWMLESRSLGGKCADLNTLFVGLCRGAGLPARDLYGLRVAPSKTFKSLGRSGDVTTAQHCRAEVYVDGFGWIPADPADVRKLVLEERAGATLTDADIAAARARFFGAWEENWIAFNDAHDVALPDSSGKALPFFMYPQIEVDGVRRKDSDADGFRYRIEAREVE